MTAGLLLVVLLRRAKRIKLSVMLRMRTGELQLPLPSAPARARFKGEGSNTVAGSRDDRVGGADETQDGSSDESPSQSSDDDSSDSRRSDSRAKGQSSAFSGSSWNYNSLPSTQRNNFSHFVYNYCYSTKPSCESYLSLCVGNRARQ